VVVVAGILVVGLRGWWRRRMVVVVVLVVLRLPWLVIKGCRSQIGLDGRQLGSCASVGVV
jgi:hypothetical protein